MADDLAIVQEIIKQHHSIRKSSEAVGEPASDIEALFGLQQAEASWSQSSLETLGAKRMQLAQAVTQLEEGLMRHFGFEEKYLPPLLGTWLMKALIIEHQDLKEKIEKAQALLRNAKFEGLGQTEMLYAKAQIWDALSDIRQTLDQHSGTEEMMLRMLEKALKNQS